MISSFIALCFESTLTLISVFSNLLRLGCDLKCDLLWRMVCVFLKRLYILLLLDEIPCIWYLVHFVYSILQILCFLIHLLSGFYPLFKVRYWNLLMLLCYYLSFPSILSVFSSYIWCSAIRYIYLFNCYIYPINWLFYHLSCPSLSLLTVFDLKSILSSMIMAHPVPCSLLVTICIFFCIL